MPDNSYQPLWRLHRTPGSRAEGLKISAKQQRQHTGEQEIQFVHLSLCLCTHVNTVINNILYYWVFANIKNNVVCKMLENFAV